MSPSLGADAKLLHSLCYADIWHMVLEIHQPILVQSTVFDSLLKIFEVRAPNIPDPLNTEQLKDELKGLKPGNSSAFWRFSSTSSDSSSVYSSSSSTGPC